jgi:hypothetical protein
MAEQSDDPTPAPRFGRGRKNRDELEALAHATADDIKAQFEVRRAQLEATNVRIEAKAGRNLFAATLIGLGLGALLIVSLIFVKEIFMVFAGALVAFTAFELASALRFAGRNVPRLPTVVAAVATVPAAFYLGVDGKWYAALAGIALVALWRTVELLRPSHRGSAVDFWRMSPPAHFVQVYIRFMAGFAVLLTAQDGGEWWSSPSSSRSSRSTSARTRVASRSVKPQDGAADQPEARRGKGFAGSVVATHHRRHPAHGLHDREAMVGRGDLRSHDGVHRARSATSPSRSSSAISASRTSAPGFRVTADSSTASTRSCRVRPPRGCCSTSSHDRRGVSAARGSVRARPAR